MVDGRRRVRPGPRGARHHPGGAARPDRPAARRAAPPAPDRGRGRAGGAARRSSMPCGRASWTPHLRELMRLEFLYAKSGGGEPLCAFTHSLTRDVAYESLPPPAAACSTARSPGRSRPSTPTGWARSTIASRITTAGRRRPPRPCSTSTRLADKAVGAHAHAEAVRILEEARAHVDRLPPAEQDRRRLELALVPGLLADTARRLPGHRHPAAPPPGRAGEPGRPAPRRPLSLPARTELSRSSGTSGRRRTTWGSGSPRRRAARTTRRGAGSTTSSPSTRPCRAAPRWPRARPAGRRPPRARRRVVVDRPGVLDGRVEPRAPRRVRRRPRRPGPGDGARRRGRATRRSRARRPGRAASSTCAGATWRRASAAARTRWRARPTR